MYWYRILSFGSLIIVICDNSVEVWDKFKMVKNVTEKRQGSKVGTTKMGIQKRFGTIRLSDIRGPKVLEQRKLLMSSQ